MPYVHVGNARSYALPIISFEGAILIRLVDRPVDRQIQPTVRTIDR